MVESYGPTAQYIRKMEQSAQLKMYVHKINMLDLCLKILFQDGPTQELSLALLIFSYSVNMDLAIAD